MNSAFGVEHGEVSKGYGAARSMLRPLKNTKAVKAVQGKLKQQAVKGKYKPAGSW